ncbi:MAG: T9SS type A sorting domain-containing protein [Bacteroidales bacterium]|nr:T9SS type A sorting domain-containing protein [Bacteroidales bacterium]
MKRKLRILAISLFSLILILPGFSEEYRFGEYKSTESIKSTAAGCAAPSGFRFLQINNVRARINTGGDMWWDLPGGIGSQYYVPANGSATSLFSGSLWIGGLDINNQLKLAALRFRQVGQDYWTGPLTVDRSASVDEETCSKYDKHFVIKREEVEEFVNWFNSENPDEEYPGYSIPTSILEYPAHPDQTLQQNKYLSKYLAPFFDVDGDGEYMPKESGDYPYYDFANNLCPTNLYPYYLGEETIYTGVVDEDGKKVLVPKGSQYFPIRTSETYYYPTDEVPVDYFNGLLVDQVLKGDETFWWIFNDKGNFHTETDGSPIGMEIRAQAFAFATNDEINNMTFYSYEIINRSTYELTKTYFCPWIDADLGYAWDDYVGCDVNRGLGYAYNGNAVDGGGQPEAYGDQPPAVGVDFFQGPYIDPDGYDNPSFRGDGLLGPTFNGDCSIVSFDSTVISMTYGPADSLVTGNFMVMAAAINGVNFGNGIIDDERFGMRGFSYHDNEGGAQGDPRYAVEYYNYLQGLWRYGEPRLYGGTAYPNTPGVVGPECDFMFPGETDPCNWGTHGELPNGGFNQGDLYWTEEQVGNNPDDRRFMQSAGPFTLKSGAVNYITVGIPWARAIAGGPWASVELLRVVDDKCQALFDNCFKVIDGPDAPDLSFREMDRELILYISNSKGTNNFREEYLELDPRIKALTPDSLLGTPDAYDPYYRFEGYQIYQLKDATVSLAESKHDPDRCRLVAQYDVKNGVTKLVNYYYDQSIGANVPVVEVTGGDNGIVHAFTVTEDKFASGDRRLVNHKQYYYSVIAYAFNNYKDYDQTVPTALDGQKEPYLSGRKNIQVYTAIPHKLINGLVMNAAFGDGPQITRIEGKGNGGQYIELAEETIEEILSKPPALTENDTMGSDTYPIAYRARYKYGYGPVDIRVIDPLNVKKGTYTIFISSIYDTVYREVTGEPILGDTVVASTGKWKIRLNETGEVFYSDKKIDTPNEQMFPELGISINVSQPFDPGPFKVGDTDQGTESQPVWRIFSDNNGLIDSYTEYADSSRRWLSGVPDNDVPGSSQNWIRSGDYQDQDIGGGTFDDYNMPNNPLDPNENWEKIENGTWAPHVLCATYLQDENGPVYAITGAAAKQDFHLRRMASVDIVLTPDKSKWTRSLVVEMCPDPVLAEGNTPRFHPRNSPSVDKEGRPAEMGDTIPSTNPNDPDYLKTTGMGWFPGYAINLETTERLNIIFGEDSWLVAENGRDMLFNPSPNIFESPSGNPLFGGKHFVYLMDHNLTEVTYGPNASDTLRAAFPAYDGCIELSRWIGYDTILPIQRIYNLLAYRSAMYVGIPLSVKDEEWLSNEVSIKIRVAKPYKRHFSSDQDTVNQFYQIDGTVYALQNNNYPMYEFTTDAIATVASDPNKKETDLDLIGVVPNPYYAYSDYETAPLQNWVRIIYLPEKCTVTIYNVSGTLIRRFTKDDPVTYIDWDLKNHAGIPIAGGIYLIHVKSDAGERIVKWFGSLRVEDFNEF